MALFIWLNFVYYLRTNGGNNFEETSPNPMRTWLFLQNPFMITVSLSLIN